MVIFLKNAVAVGDNCIDNYLEPVNKTFVGGNALNTAIALQKNGISSAYVGPVGNDQNGEKIIKKLKRKKIDISRMKKLPMKTAVTDVFLDGTERKFISENMEILNNFIIDEKTLNFIGNHDLVHNTINGSTIKYLKKFNKFNSKITFDYSDIYTDEILEETLHFVDIAFFSCSEYTIPKINNFINEFLNSGPEIFVVTLGKYGSLAYKNNGERYYQKAFKDNNIVDTLGAGDSFIGCFLSQILKGETISFSLEKASKYALEVCKHYGAWI